MSRKTPAKTSAELLTEARAALAAGRTDAAEEPLAALRRRAPDSPQVDYVLGLLRHRQGRFAEARSLLARAVPALSDDPAVCFNHATVLLEQGRPEDALEPLRRALALRPDYDDAALQLGAAQAKCGHVADAAETYRALLGRRPGHVAALLNLAAVLMDGDPEAALRHAEEAAAGAAPGPQTTAARNLVAKALSRTGREAEAVAQYEEILREDPGNVRAAFGRAITLPRVYASSAEIDVWRRHYRETLEAFAATLRLDGPERAAAAAAAVFQLGNFPLPQQGRDDRAEQALYGGLVARVAAARYPEYAEPASARPRGRRPRVGFVSAYLRRHSIAKTHGRWATGLDPRRLEVFAVHTGAHRDVVTEAFRRGCEHFIHHPRMDGSLLRLLRELELDVLIYPDVGMEPAMLLPAALRLAPVQCQGLGHPVTSGLPTIDWALTSALMEPDGGEAHYTERLERLPNLSFCYEWARIARERGGADLGDRRRGAVVFLCAQNLGKLLPAHDAVFARILAAVPDSELWFVARAETALNERFRSRLAAACEATGADPERIALHGPLDQAGFLSLTAAADVYLDGIAWSGNNTTFEAIAMGLPVVTCPGPLMRARHSAAMLAMMELTETVAETPDDYAEIAIALGRDAARRRAAAEAIRARRAVIYDDETPIRALEDFVLRVVEEGGRG